MKKPWTSIIDYEKRISGSWGTFRGRVVFTRRSRGTFSIFHTHTLWENIKESLYHTSDVSFEKCCILHNSAMYGQIFRCFYNEKIEKSKFKIRGTKQTWSFPTSLRNCRKNNNKTSRQFFLTTGLLHRGNFINGGNSHVQNTREEFLQLCNIIERDNFRVAERFWNH